MTRKEFEICSSCEQPTVEVVEMDESAQDDTVYYCSSCGEWREGNPKTKTFRLELVDYPIDNADRNGDV